MELRGIKVLLKDAAVEAPRELVELCPQIRIFHQTEENLLALEQISFSSFQILLRYIYLKQERSMAELSEGGFS